MASVSTIPTARGSRLVQALCELTEVQVREGAGPFAQRLGSLVDLADSIQLAAIQTGLEDMPFRPDVVSANGITRHFMAERGAIIRSVVRASVPGASTSRIRFPQVSGDTTLSEAQSPEPYLSFYVAQQSEIDFKVRRLQETVREQMSGLAVELARLAALDRALGQSIAGHSRGFFSAVPALLRSRFDKLLADYRETVPEDGRTTNSWLPQVERFRLELRGLLLAEIETRLLPATGLVEAVTEYDSSIGGS